MIGNQKRLIILVSKHRQHATETLADSTIEGVIYIFVASPNRREGIGSEMLQICRDRAKAAGIPLVAVTEPEGYSFFQNAAFEVGDHYEFDLAKYAASHSGFGPFRLTRMTWFAEEQ